MKKNNNENISVVIKNFAFLNVFNIIQLYLIFATSIDFT